MGSRFAGLAISVAVLAVMLLLAEQVARMLYAEDSVMFPRYHTSAEYGDYTIRRIRPDAEFWHTSRDGSWQFVTNKQGFRNREDFAYEKPAGMYRVLALGDSHTQGYEVRQDYTYAAVIEQTLRNAGRNAQVINAGVSGFSTAEALVLLEQEGLRYQPDAVVLGFFANDFEDNLKAGLYRLDDKGALVEGRKTHIPGVRIQDFIYSIPGVPWLSENSYFYSVLFNATWQFFKQQLARKSAEQVTEFAVPQKQVVGDYEQELGLALLQKLYAVCQSNGIRLIVVDIPTLDYEGLEVSSFPPELRARAGQFSDVFIDSTQLFAEQAGQGTVHVPHGHRHISELAHGMIGRTVAQRLLDGSSTAAASSPL